MAEAGFLEQKRVRPGSAAIVVLMHGAALAALLLAKSEYVQVEDERLEVEHIEVDTVPPPPPPPPKTEPQRQPETRSVIDLTQSRFQPPIPSPTVDNRPVPPSPWTSAPPGEREIVADPPAPPRVEPAPAPSPVRVEAQLSGGDLQPPYPASEERAGREGTVVIRVAIAPNGRVTGTQKVRATSDAFYEATERHARARWRFRPATVDGRPVESTKVITVHFRLDD